ncbi:hypothetical protein TNIN_236901 [Trichonephila inaurata madagascariensis]|uniref:Uncharacterized protein n=1 Tax=Trichonephila inaurata madagascariensis TaxID=2747483 RepID=A0A8X7C6Y1_9ARAC|nr:hypothetical protein TNIN_236901 [Trichonephila inaurata madagascariensis]
MKERSARSDLKYTFVDDSNDSQQHKPVKGKEKAESSSTIQNIRIPDSKTPDFEYDFNEAAEMTPENIPSGYTPRSASFSELEKNEEKLGKPTQMKSSLEPIANQSSPIANLSRHIHITPPNGTKRILRPEMNTGIGIIGKLLLATEKLLNTSWSKKYLQFLNRIYGTSLWTYMTILFTKVYKTNKDIAIFVYKSLWKILKVKDSMQLMKSHIAIMQFLVSFMGVTVICKVIGGLFYVYKMSLILLDSRNHLQRNI